MEGEVADGEPGEGGTDGGGERGVRGFVDAAGMGGRTEENASGGAKETRGGGARGMNFMKGVGYLLYQPSASGVMDALGDYGSDEDEQAGEQEEAAPPPAFVPGPEESSDEDEEEEAQSAVRKEAEAEAARKKAKKEAEEARKRPSAASALLSATAKPTFLQEHKADDGFELPVDQPAAPTPKTEDEPPPKRQAVEAPPKPAATPAAGSAGGKKPAMAKPGMAGKVDTKDKVKTQRMRGQSAHATWKSEGEMKLRQQYD